MNEKKTDEQRNAEGFMSGLDRMARESAYRREHGHDMATAVGELVRDGEALSTAKKRIAKEARRLADTEAEQCAQHAREVMGAYGIGPGRRTT